MKIGFTRLNDDIGLDPVLNKGQGVEHRRGLLHSLVLQGHDVYLFQTIRKKEAPLIRARGLGEQSWFSKMHYDLKKSAADMDVLIVECGSQNTRYSRKDMDGGTIWNVQLALQKIKEFKGKVILWHHIYAGTTLFPFNNMNPEGDSAAEMLGHLNWKRLLNGWDLFDGREWTILHHALDEEAFKQIEGAHGMKYADFPKLKFRWVHLPQSLLDTTYKIKEYPEWDALFIGSRFAHSIERKDFDRLESIKKFYDTPKYKGAVIGHFNGDSSNAFQHATNFQVPGYIPTAVSSWNNSLTSIFTEAETPRKVGAITGRTFLCLHGGSILLLDSSISNVSKMDLKEWQVSDAEDAKSKMEYLRSLPRAYHERIRAEQLSTFPYWEYLDWKEILN